MPQLQFTATEIESVQEGNFKKVHNKVEKALRDGESIKFADLQKLSLQNRENLERYKFELKNQFPNDSKVEFAINQTEVEKQADILAKTASEAFLRDNSLLARMNISEISSSVPYIRMTEFNEEQDAEVLGATDGGTSVGDKLRKGDKLMPETDSDTSKVQASFTMNEISQYFLNQVSPLDYDRRLVNRVQNKVVESVLFAGQNAANGTARTPGQIRGIVNNYGVNGTGDATNFIGAIEYATAAEVNTATGLTAANPYDVCYHVKSILMPKNLSELEESQYVYVMNRKTWGLVKTSEDLNGRYLAYSAVDPLTGRPVPMIDGTPVVLHTSVPDNFAFLIPANFYNLVMVGGIRSINDGGLVQIKEGITTFVARTYIDGSMNYGFKYKSNTAATIGTNALDNQDQNAFRYFRVN